MRSNMITKRICVEIFLDSIEEIDVRTKALVIIGKLVNVDPSWKIIAYHNEDEEQFPILEQSHDLPIPIETMSKCISAPIMLNPKSKKLLFHTRFWSVTSLFGDEAWCRIHVLVTNQQDLYISRDSKHYWKHSSAFFLWKRSSFHKLHVFVEWVKKRIFEQTNLCPDFQLNSEVIGRFKDPSTKSRAIVVICTWENVEHLKELLDIVFHSKSNFLFTPFRIYAFLGCPRAKCPSDSTARTCLK